MPTLTFQKLVKNRFTDFFTASKGEYSLFSETLGTTQLRENHDPLLPYTPLPHLMVSVR